MIAPNAVKKAAGFAKGGVNTAKGAYNTGAGIVRGGTTVARTVGGAAAGAWNGAKNGGGFGRVTGAIGGAVGGGAQAAASSMIKHRGDKAASAKGSESMSSFGQTLMGNLASGSGIGTSFSRANAARSSVRQAAAAEATSGFAVPTTPAPKTFNYNSNAVDMKDNVNSFKVNPAGGNNINTSNTGNNTPK